MNLRVNSPIKMMLHIKFNVERVSDSEEVISSLVMAMTTILKIITKAITI